MPDWTQLVKKAMAPDATETYSLYLPIGAPEAEIVQVERRLGIQLPKDLRELYLTHNGFGFSGPDAINDVDWHLVPVGRIESFSIETRAWFEETHEADAGRFFAVIDYQNGEAMGYLVSRSGECGPQISSFKLEAYDWDEDEPIEEFNTIENHSFLEYIQEISE